MLAFASAANAQTPQLVPWIYQDNGDLVWKEHRYLETLENTVFAIGREIATVPNQTGTYPDVLLCNFAHFDPPEGVSATTRRLARASVQGRGLQLYLNYSNATIDPANDTPHSAYATPTFFVSITGAGSQTIPDIEDYGFSSQTISATRAAFGVFGRQVTAHSQVMQVAPSRATGSAATLSGMVNAVFVTASIGYGIGDIDSLDATLAAESRRARLMAHQSSGVWIDESTVIPGLLPASVTSGNSSGAVFAELNGDRYMDLYVGMQGDNYGGAVDRILIYNHTTGVFEDQTSTRIVGSTPLPANATNEVAAADIDNDGDLDIVSVGRSPRTGAASPQTDDVLLVNDGSGHFTVVPLGGSVLSDSRSVAIADLDGDTYAEIVIANAGADGFSNVIDLPVTQNHVMQIFKSSSGTGFTDVSTTFVDPGLEEEATAPWSVQVLAVDVYGRPDASDPAKWSPDGYPELLIVNHRDILQSSSEAASNVHVLRNRGTNTTGDRFTYGVPWPTVWGQTLTLEDFMHTGALHFFNGCGNRFSGSQALVLWNDGPSTTPLDPPNYPFAAIDDTYDLLPGTEHGYGFDFADYDGNGFMDAAQTARSYDFLVKDIGQPTSHSAWHLDLTSPSSTQQISNARGKMNPRGGEDLCFAKLDLEEPVHAFFVGQLGCSATTPRGYSQALRQSALVCVLENPFSGAINFLHAIATPIITSIALHPIDAKIDMSNRSSTDEITSIADRVEVADMNNDGKPDVMVLYQGIGDSTTGQWKLLSSFPNPASTYLTGFSYLKNVRGDAGVPAGTWFKDVTDVCLKDASGGYSTYWNRGLGSTAIADFNNDGRLDWYATNGRATNAGTTDEFVDLEQLRDLLFMNLPAPAAAGRLKEAGATLLPPLVQEAIQDDFGGEAQTDSAGSFFVTQGDVNNDGWADVIVTHCDSSDRTAPPSLYINKIGTTGVFVDEYITRANPAAFSTATVHSIPAVDFSTVPVSLYGGAPIDNTWAIALADIDGDGDQDMFCAVGQNAPRILFNKGADTNSDGIIDSTDPLPSRLGYFLDVTDTAIPIVFPQMDANDVQAVDLDGDGDFDFGIDSFLGCNVSLWRNNREGDDKPRVTSAWPRVGSIRADKVIELQGKTLTGATTVRFRYAGGVVANVTGSNLAVVDDHRLRVTLPSTLPIGLAMIQVEVGGTWSTQYFSYFILE